MSNLYVFIYRVSRYNEKDSGTCSRGHLEQKYAVKYNSFRHSYNVTRQLKVALVSYFHLAFIIIILNFHNSLTLYVPCIVTNYINKPTRCTFCMYLFYNLSTTLHVSNDYFVHHQEFMIYSICSCVQTMQTCL